MNASDDGVVYYSPLTSAIMSGSMKRVKRRLGKPFNDDMDCGSGEHLNTPLQIAVTFGHQEIATELLKRGADCNKCNVS